MKPYLDLLRKILDARRHAENRTGMPTFKIVGETMRFDLMRGTTKILPFVTTKKLFFKGTKGELLWFLKGSTNAKELADQGIHIWDEWAVTEADVQAHPDTDLTVGDLGPIYGKMWRQAPAGEYFWNMSGVEVLTYIATMAKDQKALVDGAALQEDGTYHLRTARDVLTDIGIDQVSQAIFLLKNRPNSRRIIIDAWTPQFIPSDAISPQENVIRGRAALAYCHVLQNFVTEELTENERLALLPERTMTWGAGTAPMPAPLVLSKMFVEALSEGKIPPYEFAETRRDFSTREMLDALNIPRFRLNNVFYMRSIDCALGLPVNIASYALMTHMVAQVVNMVPGTLTWVGGDVHVYSNHVAGIEEQLTREPYPAPELWLNPEITDLFDFGMDDIKLKNYQHHEAIKFEVAV